MPERIAVGMVGCGFFAQNHLNSWRDLKAAGADLVAVCDVDAVKAKAAADKFAVPHWYTDAAAMFRDAEMAPCLAEIAPHPRARQANDGAVIYVLRAANRIQHHDDDRQQEEYCEHRQHAVNRQP